MNEGPHTLLARNISKRFYETQALDRVSFEVARGEVHTLVGENGAGKSTLINILGGVYRGDDGYIEVEGIQRDFRGPRDAQAAGIVVIPQELELVPAATVAENVTLGAWPSARALGLVARLDRRRMRDQASRALEPLRFRRDLDTPVHRLGFAERQVVAIARALCREARVLILDEPTASLEQREAERLFEVIHALKAGGTGVVFVSHRLDEVVRLADACTVLRDGRVVEVCRRGEIDADRLIRSMTGRDLAELHRPHRLRFGAPRLEVEAPASRGGPHAAAEVRVREGETVGLAGLLGSGTTEFLRGVFGAGERPAKVRLRGEERTIERPAAAIRAGIGLVPSERRQGLHLDLSVRDNIVLPNLRAFDRRWRLDLGAVNRLAGDLIEALDIRPRDPLRPVRFLSGGNQQKVMFARWLAARIDLLLLDEPTHGIDVAAKARIHRLLREFAEAGGGILLTSSDMVELVSICDSVVAMRRGRIAGRMSREAGEYSERFVRDALGG